MVEISSGTPSVLKLPRASIENYYEFESTEDCETAIQNQLEFKATRLIPHFRLLSKCIAKQQNGCMQDLDAVLGCTIWMIPDDTYDKLESLSNQELNTLCDANFYCLNWFRELINTFSNDEKLHDEDKR